MTKKSLASVLKFQWWLHTSLTSLFFIAVTFFFLFSMEDYFLEKQLIDISNIVAVNKSIKGIPSHIQIYSATEAPKAWLDQLTHLAQNDAIELNNPQGNTIHILRSKFSNSKEVFILALDTSKTNSIASISNKLLIMILPWIIIFLAIASFLAKKFIRELQEHFKQLLTTIKQSESPIALAQFSEAQSIDELAQFGQLFSQVWQQKIDILSREKQGLEYLSHELRTPIQSSLATLELLALKTQDKKAIERLTRSLNRMTRLSNTILYLMESEQLLPTYQVDVVQICQQLVDELTPLAEIKKQTIAINTMVLKTPVNIVAIKEVIETLLSILLTNALQHSNNSPITITINQDKVSIKNELKQSISSKPVLDQQGFGIGLTIAQRLANKFNLQLDIVYNEQNIAIATISNR
ncbi:HAMP domain-containing histidine kinase [Colwellia sp. BRX10-3]|uniref:sensor histidine kinase n=1 Tax=Colwellia sp. BRX10-3 TaxID=2759844 RepID=UPI0015F47EAC|nr:HAMP domain-containing sensor histidine kinase [Colwellia sp. BRX10-3]MBA6389513.1 HAMP domain-containing histidine kinase [Colwellia sp. BRX10-3]